MGHPLGLVHKRQRHAVVQRDEDINELATVKGLLVVADGAVEEDPGPYSHRHLEVIDVKRCDLPDLLYILAWRKWTGRHPSDC